MVVFVKSLHWYISKFLVIWHMVLAYVIYSKITNYGFLKYKTTKIHHYIQYIQSFKLVSTVGFGVEQLQHNH